MYPSLIKAIEKHEKTFAVFLDVAKAFDTLGHDTLEETGTLWNKKEVTGVIQVIPRKQKTMC